MPGVRPYPGGQGAGGSAITEVLKVVQGHAVAGEVQLDVLGREAWPPEGMKRSRPSQLGSIRIVLDEVLVQRVGDGRQGDGGARVAGACLLNFRVSRGTFAILMARSSSSGLP